MITHPTLDPSSSWAVGRHGQGLSGEAGPRPRRRRLTHRNGWLFCSPGDDYRHDKEIAPGCACQASPAGAVEDVITAHAWPTIAHHSSRSS